MLLLASCAKSVPFELDVELFEHAEPAAPVEPVPWDVALFDERPDAYLPAFLEVDDVGASLLADHLLQARGEGFLTVAVDALAVDVDAPLTLVVTVSSSDGRRRLVAPGADVTSPDECTTTVDRATSAEAHAADLLACLRAWTAANGGPVDFFLEVAATTADDDWSYAATWTLGADRPVSARCSGPQVLDGDIGDATVELEDLGLAGYAASDPEPLAAAAFAGTWSSADGPQTTGASASAAIGGGEGVFVGREIAADGVPVSFRDAIEPVATFPAGWAELALADLRAAEGFVDACVVEVPDRLPDETWTSFSLVGEGTAQRRSALDSGPARRIPLRASKLLTVE